MPRPEDPTEHEHHPSDRIAPVTPPPDASNQRDISLIDLEKTTLRYGDTITVDTLEGLDVIIRILARKQGYKPRRGQPVVKGRSGTAFTLADTIKKQGSKGGFNGTFKNIKVTIVPEDPEGNVDKRVKEHRFARTDFLVEADMFSTGRGKIGSICMLNSLTDVVQLYSRAIKPYQAAYAISALVTSSRENAEAAYREALEHQLSGGLPSLGKRKRK